MTTYQDVLTANGIVAGWALTEAAGTDFVPWAGGTHLTGSGGFTYQQAGPFAASFGLTMAVGATLRFPFLTKLFPPVTTEAWFKLTTVTPPSSEILLYQGDNAANGAGLYVATNGHLHALRGGSGDTDTGFVWPDLNYHLAQLVSPDTTHMNVFVDGVQVSALTIAAPLTPAPNGQGWLSDDSSYANKEIATIAWPSLYQTALSGKSAYATFLAATDPATAMRYVLSGTGQQASVDLLNLILQSVRKTF